LDIGGVWVEQFTHCGIFERMVVGSRLSCATAVTIKIFYNFIILYKFSNKNKNIKKMKRLQKLTVLMITLLSGVLSDVLISDMIHDTSANDDKQKEGNLEVSNNRKLEFTFGIMKDYEVEEIEITDKLNEKHPHFSINFKGVNGDQHNFISKPVKEQKTSEENFVDKAKSDLERVKKMISDSGWIIGLGSEEKWVAWRSEKKEPFVVWEDTGLVIRYMNSNLGEKVVACEMLGPEVGNGKVMKIYPMNIQIIGEVYQEICKYHMDQIALQKLGNGEVLLIWDNLTTKF
jgi:hypothetical protein